MEQYKPAIKQGVILGVLGVIIFLIIYAIDPLFLSTFKGMAVAFILFFLVLPIYFLVASIKKTKENFSYFKFGNALVAGMTTAVVATLIGLIFNVIFMTSVDPEWEQQVLDATVENTEALLEDSGLPDEEIEKAMTQTREEMAKKPKGVEGQLRSSLGGLGWYFLLSLIIGAIYRDKGERYEDEISDLGR